jgi:phosphoenolpyruvate mutase
MPNDCSLRDLLSAPATSYLLEAHDACSALIAQEAGFPGVWVSSLALSCAAGLRDDSELSLEPVLYTLETMANRLRIPILFDGDTGYGGFNQFRQLVRRLEKRGVSGVCIEDKLFPKSNSFVGSAKQHLCSTADFIGKLQAGLDARSDRRFVVVARTEALIIGAGMEEALRRANAFADAGVDAVLIHSKAPTFAEVREFCTRWDRSTPVICVPTRYPNTSRAEFEACGVRIAIWANHMLRASVAAMKSFAARLWQRGTPTPEDGLLAPLEELFRLQAVPELQEARARYEAGLRRAAILYGGAERAERLTAQLRALGWQSIDHVAGGEQPLATLSDWLRAQNEAETEVLLLPADLRASDRVLEALDAARVDAAILVDAQRPARHDELACAWQACGAEPEAPLLLRQMGAAAKESGVWTGAVRVRGRAVGLLARAMRNVLAEAPEQATVGAALGRMSALGAKMHVLPVYGGWSRRGV